MEDCLRSISDLVEDLDSDTSDDIIPQVALIEAQMTDLLYKLRAFLDSRARQKSQSREIYAPSRSASSRISRGSDFTNWAAVRKKTSSPQHQPPIFEPSTSREVIADSAQMREINIPISARMHLRAIEILTPAQIRADGILYFIRRTNRFVVRIAGCILQGNIGTVYVGNVTPRKIHDCSVRQCGITSCDFYHNPATFPGSTDIRNFAASSWVYHHKDSDRGRPSNHKSRKLSSRASLDEDISTVTNADLAYYNEQFMHDLLCCILMNNYVKTE